MANRTFKVYGQAYAESGDVSVAMTVNGTEVFNGAVNDSTTVREGQPTTENHLWTYELDENTVGNLTVTITATGGELCLGPTKNNLVISNVIPDSWWVDNDADLGTLEKQQHIATTIGQSALDAVEAGLYDKLQAGTATITPEGDFPSIYRANRSGPRSAEIFENAIDERLSAQINGVNMGGWDDDTTTNALNWPIVQDGETFTYTWVFDPDSSPI